MVFTYQVLLFRSKHKVFITMRFIFLIVSLFSSAVVANCNGHWEDVKKIQLTGTHVVQKKAFFYSAPFNKYKYADLFLIKGDRFHSYLESNGYIFGRYIRKNGTVVNGWLKAEALVDTSSKFPYFPLELSENDFVIVSPYKDIELGGSYERFYKAWGKCEINKQPDIGISGNFITSGVQVYKYFDHHWGGFSIRSSNINFNNDGEDFDTYRVTTVTVNNDKYMTSRGIAVGDTIESVISAYGQPLKMDKTQVSYKFKRNSLLFNIKSNVVDNIVMDEQFE